MEKEKELYLKSRMVVNQRSLEMEVYTKNWTRLYYKKKRE